MNAQIRGSCLHKESVPGVEHMASEQLVLLEFVQTGCGHHLQIKKK